MQISIIGVPFTIKGAHGDFGWMIQQQMYSDVLFIFNENYIASQCNETTKGAGSAVVRPYTYKLCDNPRAVGVPTGWCVGSGGFKSFDRFSKLAVDYAFDRIKRVLHEQQHLRRVMFSCDENDYKTIGSKIFNINENVIQHIMKRFKELEDYDTETEPRKTHDEIDGSEEILLIHARLHEENSKLKQELQLYKKRPTSASWSFMNQSKRFHL